MILTSDLFKQKQFPKWFSSHPIFKEVDRVKKVFVGIGLPNCEEEINIDNSGPAKQAALDLLYAIKSNISERLSSLEAYIEKKQGVMGAARKENGWRCMLLLNTLQTLMADGKDTFITENNGRTSIKLPSDISLDGEDRPTFREGESLFRVYNKLNALLVEGKFAKMQRLEDIEAFKTFSTENVPNNKLKVVFSADGADGAWDIATMSMRGVKSCQSWDGQYKHCTIGSVIDPFVGIIYLTSGAKFSNNGSRMIRRCIVRFVVDSKTIEPYLLMDYMYPSVDTATINRFKTFLKAKTNGKFDVQYAPTMADNKDLRNTYMPLNEIRKRLKETTKDGDKDPNGYNEDTLNVIASYQDIRIADKTSNKNDKHGNLFAKNSKKKAHIFVKHFEKALTVAIQETDIDMFPLSLQPSISKLKGKDKTNFSYSYIIPNIANNIAKHFIKSVDKDSHTSSDIYARRIYCSYFNNKTAILNDIKTSMAKELNGRLQPKGNNKIGSDQFMTMMKILLPKIDTAMKDRLKELLIKSKLPKTLPLP